MPYANTRPDSPKGRIFKSYRETGEDAAMALAKRLDVELTRVKRWFVQWRDLGSRPKKASAKLSKPNGIKKGPPPKKAAANKTAPKKAKPVQPSKTSTKVFKTKKKKPAPKKKPSAPMPEKEAEPAETRTPIEAMPHIPADTLPYIPTAIEDAVRAAS